MQNWALGKQIIYETSLLLMSILVNKKKKKKVNTLK